jgi:SAM-dependent methyltransferase
MQKKYETKYHQLEETNWWFVGRRHMIALLLKDLPRDARVLEIGCSSGPLLRLLSAMGFTDLQGIDISKEAIRMAEQSGQRVRVMDGLAPKLDGRFDVIIASDVLEHIEDDSMALKNWARLLGKKGKLILFVPAWRFLWSGHDVANSHFRRYSLLELRTKVGEAGLRVKRASFWNMVSFVPLAMLNTLRKRAGTDSLQRTGKVSNSVMVLALKLENRVARFVNLPFGVSAMVVAEKDKACHK